ncbi:MAG: alanine racemase, partial [Clostridia bacterium]|nr:alanine racemase [Clostridia bacterium]
MQKTLSVISLPSIRRNAEKIKSLIHGCKFFAVVKADGYGHGAEEVSRYIEDIADGFCVAIVEEGIALRVAGISKQILVLTPPQDGYDVARAKAYNLTLTVNSVHTARLIKGAPCHIKVNTGMNRHGCNIDGLPQILSCLPKDSVEGVYSHLFAPENDLASESQFAHFSKAVKTVKQVNPCACAHI